MWPVTSQISSKSLFIGLRVQFGVLKSSFYDLKLLFEKQCGVHVFLSLSTYFLRSNIARFSFRFFIQWKRRKNLDSVFQSSNLDVDDRCCLIRMSERQARNKITRIRPDPALQKREEEEEERKTQKGGISLFFSEESTRRNVCCCCVSHHFFRLLRFTFFDENISRQKLGEI